MDDIVRRAFMKGAGIGALAFTVDGVGGTITGTNASGAEQLVTNWNSIAS